MHFAGVSKLDVVEINGEPRLQETDTELITFSYGKASMRLNNLYNGDPILREMNTYFIYFIFKYINYTVLHI